MQNPRQSCKPPLAPALSTSSPFSTTRAEAGPLGVGGPAVFPTPRAHGGRFEQSRSSRHSTPGGPGLVQVVRGRLRGVALPTMVLLLSLVLLVWPMVSWADASSSSSPSAWLAILTGLVGVLSGGGALYRTSISAARFEARATTAEHRLRDLEDRTSGGVTRAELDSALSGLRADLERNRKEAREDVGSLRGEMAELREQCQSLAQQNDLILQALDKLAGRN